VSFLKSRSLRFLREKDADLDARAAAEELRQFGEPFPNLVPSDEGQINAAKRTMAVSRQVDDHLDSKQMHLFNRHILPQVPHHLQVLPSTTATKVPEANASKLSATLQYPPSPIISPGKNIRMYVAAVSNESDAPEARDLPIPWFWLHPIASTDARVLDVLEPIMRDDDSAALKRMVQQWQWRHARYQYNILCIAIAFG
jgi:hypothetical protein